MIMLDKMTQIRSFNAGTIVVHQPDKKGQDDNASKKIIDEEKYCVDLRVVSLRLLSGSNDAGRNRHHIYPTLERDNLEENK